MGCGLRSREHSGFLGRYSASDTTVIVSAELPDEDMEEMIEAFYMNEEFNPNDESNPNPTDVRQDDEGIQ